MNNVGISILEEVVKIAGQVALGKIDKSVYREVLWRAYIIAYENDLRAEMSVIRDEVTRIGEMGLTGKIIFEDENWMDSIEKDNIIHIALMVWYSDMVEMTFNERVLYRRLLRKIRTYFRKLENEPLEISKKANMYVIADVLTILERSGRVEEVLSKMQLDYWKIVCMRKNDLKNKFATEQIRANNVDEIKKDWRLWL